MATASLAPFLQGKYLDANGNPLSGGFVYTYQSGTSTPQVTYSSSVISVPTQNANPVELDTNGDAPIWLDPALSYKFVIKNSSGVTQRTIDNVIGLLTNDAVATASIQDLAVTTAKLADDSVTAAKLKDSASVDADRAVTTDHIRDANVTRAKLAAGAVPAQTVTASKTSNYTATNADDFIPCSSSGGIFTVTLYAASGNSGRVITIKKTDSSFNAITIDGNASETIDGATTTTLNTQYETVRLICDGSNWHIMERSYPTAMQSFTMSIEGSTSNPTKGTTTTDNAQWARERDGIRIRFSYRQTGAGSAGSGNYLFLLPNSLQIDTAKQPVSASSIWSVTGYGFVSANGDANNRHANVAAYDATHLALITADFDGGYAAVGSTAYGLDGATVEYCFDAWVPISGWKG